MKRFFLTALMSLGLSTPTFGALYFSQTFSTGFQNNGAIPDGSLNGLADTRTVSGASGLLISGITVTLNISGGYNGDLYAYLSHGGGTAILLNRAGIGSTPGDAFGASGSGLSSLVFTTSANSGNVHFLLGNGNNAGGTFAPDGRAISPLSAPSAFNSAATTANFSTITGDPNGSWTLFFADTVTGGGTPTLTSWSLSIDAVPEPITVALGIFGVVFVGVAVGRRLRSRAGA